MEWLKGSGKEIKHLFHMTLLLMFDQHWRTVGIFACIAAGIFDLMSLAMFVVTSLCAQLMFLKSVNKNLLLKMFKWNFIIFVPVMLVSLGLIASLLYLGPPTEQPTQVMKDAVFSISNVFLSIAMCLLMAALVIVTFSKLDNLDKGFIHVFHTIFQKPESRIPLFVILLIEIASMQLEIGSYTALPLIVSWVITYGYDMRIQKKKKEKSKSVSFVPSFQN